MLAEIYFLRLEAIARARSEVVPARTFRFVPVAVDAVTELWRRRRRTVAETSVSPATGDARRGQAG